MTFSDRKGVLPTWLAGLCIAMLLSSTTAQVLDFCELNDLGDGIILQSQQASPGSAFCYLPHGSFGGCSRSDCVVFSDLP